MGSELLQFLASRNIEIALKPSGEQDGLTIPGYNVRLRKGEKEESFVIFGDSETEQRMTPEDALRALLIRARLHENNAVLSPGFDMLCGETATRLKKFLGPDNYSDFLKLMTNPEHTIFENEKPGFKSFLSYSLHFQNSCNALYQLTRKNVFKVFMSLSSPLAYIWKFISTHMPKNTTKL